APETEADQAAVVQLLFGGDPGVQPGLVDIILGQGALGDHVVDLAVVPVIDVKRDQPAHVADIEIVHRGKKRRRVVVLWLDRPCTAGACQNCDKGGKKKSLGYGH